jgi:hypothetical protein
MALSPCVLLLKGTTEDEVAGITVKESKMSNITPVYPQAYNILVMKN